MQRALSGPTPARAFIDTLGGIGQTTVYELGPLLGLLPKTSSGIGLTSPFSAVLDAHPAAKVEKNYWDTGQSATLTDTSGNAMRFTSDGAGEVVQISVGRTKYIANDDGCG